MRKTRASNYKHRVTIEKNTEARGTTGESEKTWALYASRRMSIEPLQGKELFTAQQFQKKVTHKIKVRHDSALDPITDAAGVDYRLTYNSKTYMIDAAFNMFEADKEVHFLCYTYNE